MSMNARQGGNRVIHSFSLIISVYTQTGGVVSKICYSFERFISNFNHSVFYLTLVSIRQDSDSSGKTWKTCGLGIDLKLSGEISIMEKSQGKGRKIFCCGLFSGSL